MRLFIAIRFTDEVKKALLGTMHDLKQKGIKGNYAPAANLHVTLAFIGETRQTDEIKKALDRVQFTPFKLTVREMGNFGDRLWAGVKGNQGLKGLAKDIRARASYNAGAKNGRDASQGISGTKRGYDGAQHFPDEVRE